jgi:RNA polymerase sigma factor for flagellar operon FliA
VTPEQTKLVEQHLSLVEKLASHISRKMPPSVERDDLVQFGYLGLIDAATKFRPDNEAGASFATFAGWRIRGAIFDGLRIDAWPRTIRKFIKLRNQAYTKLEAAGLPITDASTAAMMGLPQEKYDAQSLRIQSLYKPDHESIEHTTAEDLFLGDETNALLHNALRTLEVRDQLVLRMYYFENRTMAEVSEAIGVNESRVSQLHKRALGRLRDALTQPPESISAV